jgi:hypothetical protein
LRYLISSLLSLFVPSRMRVEFQSRKAASKAAVVKQQATQLRDAPLLSCLCLQVSSSTKAASDAAARRPAAVSKAASKAAVVKQQATQLRDAPLLSCLCLFLLACALAFF